MASKLERDFPKASLSFTYWVAKSMAEKPDPNGQRSDPNPSAIQFHHGNLEPFSLFAEKAVSRDDAVVKDQFIGLGGLVSHLLLGLSNLETRACPFSTAKALIPLPFRALRSVTAQTTVTPAASPLRDEGFGSIQDIISSSSWIAVVRMLAASTRYGVP